MSDRSAASYRLEPRDGAGLLLGLEAVPCVLLGTGLLLAALAVTAGMPIASAGVIAAVTAVGAVGRFRGMPLWEWLVLGTRWTATSRHRNWRTTLWSELATTASVPPFLSHVGLRELRSPHGPMGAITNRAEDSLTVVVPVTGGEFLLSDAPDQAHLLARWGDVLAQFATEHGGVAHLSWSDLAHPSGLDQHRCWLADQTTHPNNLERSQAALASYDELIDQAPARAMCHDVVITLTVDRRHLGTGRGGSGPLTTRLERATLTALDILTRSLDAAGLHPAPPLQRHQLTDLLRARMRPTPHQAGPSTHSQQRLAGHGPMAVTTAWDHVRIDSSVQRTWWIGDWPRHPVGPAWLEPFLSVSGLTRTVTVVLAPVPAHQSRRRIERELIKLDSDAVTKEDKGRRVDARHRRATQALLDREEQIVAGHPEIAYLGLVTLTAVDLDTLDAHSDLLEQEARASGIDLRVLYARQDLAWAASLPLGLAPRTTVVG